MIKKRNLDPSLIQWIMSQTGLGPGIGEMFWVAPAASATSQFRTQLQSWGVEQNYVIHTSPIDAQAKMVAGRNDIMLIMPGTYTITGTNGLAWDLDYTHMLGLAHPHTEAVILQNPAGGTTVVSALYNTGDHNQFHNVSFENKGNATACKAGVREAGQGNLYRGCNIRGEVGATQVTGSNLSSLWIDTSATKGGKNARFEDCLIGSHSGTVTTGFEEGAILIGISGGAACGKDIEFYKCKVLSRSVTEGHNAIKVSGNYCLDGLLTIDNCAFYNYYAGDSFTRLTTLISDKCTTDHAILVRNSTNHGWTNWGVGTDGKYVFGGMPGVGAGGGIAALTT